jgi:phage baseplate assembly protein W
MVDITARQPKYKDLDLDFIAHPTTKDVVKKSGDEAIKRSVRNLILTNFYDRPFRHYVGSGAQKLLFENMNRMTETFLSEAIQEVITNYEPRVNLKSLEVRADHNNNGYTVILQYVILNTSLPVTISLFLERIR